MWIVYIYIYITALSQQHFLMKKMKKKKSIKNNTQRRVESIVNMVP